MRGSDVVALVLLIAAGIVAAAALGVGIWGPAPEEKATPASTFAPPQVNASADANATAGNATAGANQTASAGNQTSQQYDYSACMPGMDMPGCPADVAARYYAQQMANYTPPPPDKVLPNVKIDLDPQGANKAGAFAIDNGTKQLLVDVYVNDTGTGPYLALGPGGQGDLALTLKGPSGSKPIALSGSGNSVGVDPVLALSRTYHVIVADPGEGAWSVTLDGQGANVVVDVHMVERFYS